MAVNDEHKRRSDAPAEESWGRWQVLIVAVLAVVLVAIIVMVWALLTH